MSAAIILISDGIAALSPVAGFIIGALVVGAYGLILYAIWKGLC